MIKPADGDEYLRSGCMRCKQGGTLECKVHRWTKELSELPNTMTGRGMMDNNR